MTETLKLNLGCGDRLLDGYINVDKFGNPDIKCDLEVFPWPWNDSCAEEVILSHVLEHLGSTADIYLNIIKELYRVCKPDAIVKIDVPHPRHDDFITDPTHCRVVTPRSLLHFDQQMNQYWIQNRFSDTPLGVYLKVDFRIIEVINYWTPEWHKKLISGEISNEQLMEAEKAFSNVMSAYHIKLKVIKPEPTTPSDIL